HERWTSGYGDTNSEIALCAIGTNALPALVAMAGSRATGVRMAVGELAREKDLAFLHLPPQDDKHETATWGLRVLGPRARPAVPFLIDLLGDRDPEVRRTAALCLAGIGAEGVDSVPALLGVLSRSRGTNAAEVSLRSAAIRALGEIGAPASSSIPQ